MSEKKQVWVISKVKQQIVDPTKFDLEMRSVSSELGVPYVMTVNRNHLQRIMGNFGVSRWDDLVQETFMCSGMSDKRFLHSLLNHRITFNIMEDRTSLASLTVSGALNLYNQISFGAQDDLVKTLHLEDFNYSFDQKVLRKLYISLIEAQADFLYRIEPIVGRFLSPNQSEIVANALWQFDEDFGSSEELTNKERNWTDRKKYLNLKSN